MTQRQPIRSVGRLSASEAEHVLALAAEADRVDGAYPLSEDVVLQLRHPTTPGRHLLSDAGYAYLNEENSGELFVAPAQRRQGQGTALLAEAGAGALTFWAHGDEPGARAFAERNGFARSRVLFQMRRSLTEPLPEVPLPAGVTLRHFRPGHDEQDWLGVNSRAFASHPEQGKWTLDDVRLREDEPWFDPAGFLLAVDVEDTLLGFHWTKVHPAAGDDPELGEIYVLGVDPGGQSRGLGKALSVAGLQYLRDRGLTGALLYVDESNTAAVALYQRLGFSIYKTDVQYAR